MHSRKNNGAKLSSGFEKNKSFPQLEQLRGTLVIYVVVDIEYHSIR